MTHPAISRLVERNMRLRRITSATAAHNVAASLPSTWVCGQCGSVNRQGQPCSEGC